MMRVWNILEYILCYGSICGGTWHPSAHRPRWTASCNKLHAHAPHVHCWPSPVVSVRAEAMVTLAIVWPICLAQLPNWQQQPNIDNTTSSHAQLHILHHASCALVYLGVISLSFLCSDLVSPAALAPHSSHHHEQQLLRSLRPAQVF